MCNQPRLVSPDSVSTSCPDPNAKWQLIIKDCQYYTVSPNVQVYLRYWYLAHPATLNNHCNFTSARQGKHLHLENAIFSPLFCQQVCINLEARGELCEIFDWWLLLTLLWPGVVRSLSFWSDCPMHLLMWVAIAQIKIYVRLLTNMLNIA